MATTFGRDNDRVLVTRYCGPIQPQDQKIVSLRNRTRFALTAGNVAIDDLTTDDLYRLMEVVSQAVPYRS